MSRVWTEIVSRWNGERYVTIEAESAYVEYDGPVALCKGDPIAKQSEQVSLENQKNQLEFTKQLDDIFTKQYGDQKETLDYLKSKLTPQVENPQGYSEPDLNAMRTGATDNISTQYNNAQKALQQQRFSNGSRDLPSGVDDQLLSSLDAAHASDEAGTQNQITQNNENLKQQNYWNAVNALGGNAAAFNPQSYAGEGNGASGASSSAGNATSNASQAYQASKKGFFSNLANSFASGLGGAAGSFLGGGNAGSGGGGYFGL